MGYIVHLMMRHLSPLLYEGERCFFIQLKVLHAYLPMASALHLPIANLVNVYNAWYNEGLKCTLDREITLELYTSIFALIISVVSAVFSLVAYLQGVSHDRRQATLDAYNLLQEQALDRLNDYAPAAMREIAKNSRSAEFKTVSKYLARIEHFCVGVNQKIYDENVLYELAHGYLDGSIRTRAQPIIDKKQEGKAERYYANFETVINKMQKKTERKNRGVSK